MDPPARRTEESRAVKATLKYLVDGQEKPVFHASQGGGDTTQYIGRYENRPVTLRDGRAWPGL